MEYEQKGDKLVLKPEGKITAANVDEVKQTFLEWIEKGQKDLIVDLSGVDIIDSKGLAVFIVCNKTLSESGGSLTVVTDKQDLLNLFHVMRLDQQFTICRPDAVGV